MSTIEIQPVDNLDAPDTKAGTAAPGTRPLSSLEDGATKRLAAPSGVNESTGSNGADRDLGISGDAAPRLMGMPGSGPAAPGKIARENLPAPASISVPFAASLLPRSSRSVSLVANRGRR